MLHPRVHILVLINTDFTLVTSAVRSETVTRVLTGHDSGGSRPIRIQPVSLAESETAASAVPAALPWDSVQVGEVTASNDPSSPPISPFLPYPIHQLT